MCILPNRELKESACIHVCVCVCAHECMRKRDVYHFAGVGCEYWFKHD